jgi:hypothetical protein
VRHGGNKADGIGGHLPRGVLDAGVDFLQFGGGKWTHRHTRAGNWTSSIDDNHATGHAASRVKVHVTMHHDQAASHGIAHATTEFSSGEDQTVVHGRAKVVVAAVFDDDGATSHGPAGHGANVSLTKQPSVLQSCTKHATGIATVVK